MSFDSACQFVIAEEGGYVNNPQDPGGETKYGISKRQYPTRNIPKLTVGDARQIYFEDYWLPSRCPDLPPAVAMALFDSAVNAGSAQAVKWLQAAVHATQDGIVGPDTLRRADEADPLLTAQDVLARRLAFYGSLSTFPTFGLGWCRRVLRLHSLILKGN